MLAKDAHGFNYDGSWGTSGLDLWMHHDHGRMATEIARGKRYFPKWNVCRWWLSEGAFQRDPDRFLANLDAGLGLFADNGILVIPLLFNRWRDPTCDFGGVSLEHLVPGLSLNTENVSDLFRYVEDEWPRDPTRIEGLHRRYVEAVVGAHLCDERIWLWDLCNEPLMGDYAASTDNLLCRAELQWLSWIYGTCKRLGATQQLTIGNYAGYDAIRMTEPISDVISFHPYYIWNAEGASETDFEANLDRVVGLAQACGKELIASETVWGAASDEQHVEVMRYTLGQLKQRGIGFTVHALQHSLVADLHYAAYGPVGFPEVLHFINPDGTLRKGHDAFNAYC